MLTGGLPHTPKGAECARNHVTVAAAHTPCVCFFIGLGALPQVDAALSDKVALKENLSKVLGGGGAPAKEPAAEGAAAEAPKA